MFLGKKQREIYLVRIMSGRGSVLALLTGSELGEVSVVVALPVSPLSVQLLWNVTRGIGCHAHLVVEDFGLAGLGLGNQRLVEDVQDILADLLKLGLDLLAIVADGRDMLVSAL